MSSIIIPKTPLDFRKNLAFAESRQAKVVPDEVTVMFCTDEFLQDIEGRGIRRKVMHDLGFNMEKDAEPPERIRINLENGYDIFDRTLKEDPKTGLKEPVGYRRIKGRGFGSIITQGDKHGES